jgi:hypothetical protein
MSKRTIFKVIAVTNFVILFEVFLMFRNGSFNNYLYKNGENNFTSANGGVGTKYNADSVRATIDLFQQEQKIEKIRLSSSKSMGGTENWSRPRNFAKDSMLVYPSNKEKKMIERSKSEMMYSSKSGMIIDPKLFSLDSLLKEKEKQKK